MPTIVAVVLDVPTVTVPDPVSAGITVVTLGSDESNAISATVKPVVFVDSRIIVVGPRVESDCCTLALIPAVCEVSAMIAAMPTITMSTVSAVRTFFSLRSL